MKDPGAAKPMLGIGIIRNRRQRKITVCQQQYTQHVIERFGMESSRSGHTAMEKTSLAKVDHEEQSLPINVPFHQAIGSLIYLVSCTRPDLAFAVNRLSQFVESPQIHHLDAVKHVIRYLSGTKAFGIQCSGLG